MSESNGQYLTRDALLAAAGLDYRECVEVPGLGKVWVRALSAQDREVWESMLLAQMDTKEKGSWKNAPKYRVRPLMVILSACDENGNLLFTMDDLDAVASLPIHIIMPIFDLASKISKVTSEDVDKLEGNSVASPSVDSVSISPSPSE